MAVVIKTDLPLKAFKKGKVRVLFAHQLNAKGAHDGV